MAMLTFVLTVIVLSVAIYKGYRFSMSLYAHGVVGERAHRGSAFEEDIRPVGQKQQASLMLVQDYGMRYARVGLLIVAGVTLLIVLGLIILMLSVL